jgi:hypothetical protein
VGEAGFPKSLSQACILEVCISHMRASPIGHLIGVPLIGVFLIDVLLQDHLIGGYLIGGRLIGASLVGVSLP